MQRQEFFKNNGIRGDKNKFKRMKEDVHKIWVSIKQLLLVLQ